MKIDAIDKNSLRFKEVEKIFTSSQISTELILKTFRNQEKKRMLSSSRAYQFTPEKKQQKPKFNLLHVTGKELQNGPEFGSNIKRKDIKGIRMALERPLSQLVEVLQKDTDYSTFEKQVSQLRRHSQEKEKSQKLRERNSSSLKEFQVIKPTRYVDFLFHSQFRQYTPEEHLILNHPVLMKKVLFADSTLRRQEVINSRKIWQNEQKLRQSPQLPKIQTSQEENMFRICRQFQLSIDLSNQSAHQPPIDGQYKACIELGNNGILIKSLIQSRPWWALRSASEIQNCNFVWTQWKNDHIIELLSKKKKRKSIQQNHVKVVKGNLFNQEKFKEFDKLIDKNSSLWNFFEPSGSGYLSFGKKIDTNKIEQFIKKNFDERRYKIIHNCKEQRMVNHLPGCLELHSKKLLHLNMKNYLEKNGIKIEEYFPTTYHVKGENDLEFKSFCQDFEYKKYVQNYEANSNVWICKPGQNSNRGNGIAVSNNLEQIVNLVKQRCQGDRTLIIQKYIENPLLFNKRKFDIRCFILVTTVNGIIKCYWYEQGYIRTTSKQYNMKNLSNKFVHLTNDAIQKKSTNYGKFEHCNKISFSDFQKYLETIRPTGPSMDQILNKMKNIAIDMVKSVAEVLNSNFSEYSFELFGLDFMLDQDLKPYLIEANSNPSLEIAGTVLSKIIPSLIENVLRVAVDPVFPPPKSQSQRARYKSNNFFESNKMRLIFDSSTTDNDNDHQSHIKTEDMTCINN